VNYYLSIPHQIRMPKTINKNGQTLTNNCEKYLLRRSFSFAHYNNSLLLPEEIIWRKKEAFSDGVSGSNRSLYAIIQEHVSQKDLDLSHQYTFNPPQTKEQLYYRNIFHSFYPNLEGVIPYFWMPKYIQATDPSARTLTIYKD
jgi:asparagine synthase (glutamine-hydrolysing)